MEKTPRCYAGTSHWMTRQCSTPQKDTKSNSRKGCPLQVRNQVIFNIFYEVIEDAYPTLLSFYLQLSSNISLETIFSQTFITSYVTNKIITRNERKVHYFQCYFFHSHPNNEWNNNAHLYNCDVKFYVYFWSWYFSLIQLKHCHLTFLKISIDVNLDCVLYKCFSQK